MTLSADAGAWGPRRSPKWVRWGEEEQCNERVFAAGGDKGYETCSDEGGASLEFLEGLELPGVACLLDK